MLLELHIRRTRNGVGSNISFGKTVYRFEPRPDVTDGDDEAHVCEVEDEAHLSRLLSIPEYTPYGQDMKEPEPEPEPVLVEIPDEPSETDKLQEEEDADLELQMCETIVSMKVSDAVAELEELSDESLAQLAVMESAGKARKSLLEAISDHQQIREEGGYAEEG